LEQAGHHDAVRMLFEDDEAVMAILGMAEVRRAVVATTDLLEISPTLYFLVVVRHVFDGAGMTSAGLTRYVAAVLATRVNPPHTPDRDDVLPDYAVDFVARAETASRSVAARGSESFAWWKAAGDHFLVLTGLFPSHLETRRDRQGAPALEFYDGFAAQSYRTAADHPQARRRGLSPILHDLSDAFPTARKALNQAAEEYFFLAS